MSKEQAPRSAEQNQAHEQINHQEQLERIRERLEHGAENAPSPEEAQETLEAARNKAEQAATSKDEVLKSLKSESNSQRNDFSPIDRKLTFEKTMDSVQSQLSKPRKTFSKIIHQPTVEKISENASKTIGRPSVLLGGFSFTFIGSLLIYLIMQRNGYGLSSLSFMLFLFALGAAVGLATEFVRHRLRNFR